MLLRWSLLQRPVPEAIRTAEVKENERRRRSGRRIRCPRCGWEPSRGDRWACTCQHVWNTFDTGGVCPGCGYRWMHTCCLRCLEWSPHADWYGEDPGPGDCGRE